MHAIVFLFAFCFASAALAQPVDPAKTSSRRSPEEIKEIKERVDYWLKTCLGDWDAASHMTKSEWRTTCNRVATERGAFVLRNPDSFSIKTKNQPR